MRKCDLLHTANSGGSMILKVGRRAKYHFIFKGNFTMIYILCFEHTCTCMLDELPSKNRNKFSTMQVVLVHETSGSEPVEYQ